MLKLLYEILIDPLGLPVSFLWEYIILLVVEEIVHKVAFDISPGGTFGSFIYWFTKLIAFIVTWAILYAVITSVQFLIAHWIWFVVGLFITGIIFIFVVPSKTLINKSNK